LNQLTISSDASVASPGNVLREILNCVQNHRYKLETLLPLVTTNPAKVLKLQDKGRIQAGFQADFLVLDRQSLALKHVISQGRFRFRDGELMVREKFLEDSNRWVSLRGDQSLAPGVT